MKLCIFCRKWEKFQHKKIKVGTVTYYLSVRTTTTPHHSATTNSLLPREERLRKRFANSSSLTRVRANCWVSPYSKVHRPITQTQAKTGTAIRGRIRSDQRPGDGLKFSKPRRRRPAEFWQEDSAPSSPKHYSGTLFVVPHSHRTPAPHHFAAAPPEHWTSRRRGCLHEELCTKLSNIGPVNYFVRSLRPPFGPTEPRSRPPQSRLWCRSRQAPRERK